MHNCIKRAFDFVVALFGLLLLTLFLSLAAILIKTTSPGPVFYRGERVGRNGRIFRVFKFRTMISDAEITGPSSTADFDNRITPIGRVLRRYKLDELPQLINVLLGDMSFVGPRPEVKKFTDKYTEEERIIYSMRPGITDWSSLKFNNEGEILRAYVDQYPDADAAYEAVIRPEKLRLQIEYVRNHNLLIDLRLIILTLWKIIH